MFFKVIILLLNTDLNPDRLWYALRCCLFTVIVPLYNRWLINIHTKENRSILNYQN